MTQLNVLKKYMIINIYIYGAVIPSLGPNNPTDQPNPMRPTDRPVHVPAPSTPPVRPRATHPTPLRPTNPATPDPAHPNPVSPDIAPLPPPSHASPVGEHRFLLCLTLPHHRRAPLPPPLIVSPAQRPCLLLHPAPLPPTPLPPPSLCLTK
jgi:hypothetical protein